MVSDGDALDADASESRHTAQGPDSTPEDETLLLSPPHEEGTPGDHCLLEPPEDDVLAPNVRAGDSSSTLATKEMRVTLEAMQLNNPDPYSAPSTPRMHTDTTTESYEREHLNGANEAGAHVLGKPANTGPPHGPKNQLAQRPTPGRGDGGGDGEEKEEARNGVSANRGKTPLNKQTTTLPDSLKEQQELFAKTQRENFDLKIQVSLLKEQLRIYRSSDTPEQEMQQRLKQLLVQKERELLDHKQRLGEQTKRIDALLFETSQLQQERQEERELVLAEFDKQEVQNATVQNELKKKVEDLTTQLDDAHRQVAMRVDSTEPVMQSLVERSVRDGQVLSDYARKLRHTILLKDEYAQRIRELDAEVESLLGTNEVQRVRLDELERDYSLSKLRCAEADKRMQELEREAADLMESRVQVEIEYKTFKDRAEGVAAMEAEVIASLKKEKETLVREGQTLSGKLAGLEKNYRRAQELLSLYARQVAEYDRTTERLTASQDQAALLRRQNEKLTQALSTLTQEIHGTSVSSAQAGVGARLVGEAMPDATAVHGKTAPPSIFLDGRSPSTQALSGAHASTVGVGLGIRAHPQGPEQRGLHNDADANLVGHREGLAVLAEPHGGKLGHAKGGESYSLADHYPTTPMITPGQDKSMTSQASSKTEGKSRGGGHQPPSFSFTPAQFHAPHPGRAQHTPNHPSYQAAPSSARFGGASPASEQPTTTPQRGHPRPGNAAGSSAIHVTKGLMRVWGASLEAQRKQSESTKARVKWH